jgi:hypothetical protein
MRAIRPIGYDTTASTSCTATSLIEHVGGQWRRQAFAEAARSLADHHWVQTPYSELPNGRVLGVTKSLIAVR